MFHEKENILVRTRSANWYLILYEKFGPWKKNPINRVFKKFSVENYYFFFFNILGVASRMSRWSNVNSRISKFSNPIGRKTVNRFLIRGIDHKSSSRKKGMTIREKCKARMKHQRLENLRKSWSKRAKRRRRKK